jgi:hypothetical protein
MSKTPLGEVQVTLADGTRLTLRRDLRAMAVAELAAGASMATIAAAASSGGPQLMYGAAIFFGTLRAHHPELTLDDAFRMLEQDGERIKTALEDSGAAAAVQPGSAATNPGKALHGKSGGAARTNGTGTRSTPRGAKKG